MTLSLLWFHGISGNTSMRDIGWSYVVIAACLIFVVVELFRWRQFEKKYAERYYPKE